MELKEILRNEQNEKTAQVRMRLCKALKQARTSKEMSQKRENQSEDGL